jgi:hypothetical protein
MTCTPTQQTAIMLHYNLTISGAVPGDAVCGIAVGDANPASVDPQAAARIADVGCWKGTGLMRWNSLFPSSPSSNSCAYFVTDYGCHNYWKCYYCGHHPVITMGCTVWYQDSKEHEFNLGGEVEGDFIEGRPVIGAPADGLTASIRDDFKFDCQKAEKSEVNGSGVAYCGTAANALLVAVVSILANSG